MSKVAPLEIEALSKIVDELDYYQLLHLEPGATQQDIRSAYHQASRSFHPDANHHLDGTVLTQCSRVAKRITEAYCVLRDPRRRKVYDQQVEAKLGMRMQLGEAKAAHQRLEAKTRHGITPQGRQFFQKGLAALESGDTAQAASHIQMALTFEPDNAGFREKLEQAKARK